MRKPSKDKGGEDEPGFPGGRARERVEQFRRSRGLGEVPAPGPVSARERQAETGSKTGEVMRSLDLRRKNCSGEPCGAGRSSEARGGTMGR